MFMSLSYLKWWIYNTSHRWGMLIDLRFLLTSQYMWLQFHVWSSYLLAPSQGKVLTKYFCIYFLIFVKFNACRYGMCWHLFGAPITQKNRRRCSLVRRGRSAAQGRTVRDLARGGGALWSGVDGPRPRAGRSATWRQGRLPPPCWNLDLVPWGEKILRCSGSTGHPGCPKTTWSRLGIKRSIRGRCLGWTTRSCPPGGVRS
jgi:hypothetical protein